MKRQAKAQILLRFTGNGDVSINKWMDYVQSKYNRSTTPQLEIWSNQTKKNKTMLVVRMFILSYSWRRHAIHQSSKGPCQKGRGRGRDDPASWRTRGLRRPRWHAACPLIRISTIIITWCQFSKLINWKMTTLLSEVVALQAVIGLKYIADTA